MAFKMKGFSGFAKTTNSPMTKTGSDDNISISTDLIKQQQGESTGDFKLRQRWLMLVGTWEILTQTTHSAWIRLVQKKKVKYQ